jgi:hypothetical protein
MSNSKYAIPAEEERALKIVYLRSKLSESDDFQFDTMDNAGLDLMIQVACLSYDERSEIVDEINIATGKSPKKMSSSNPSMNRFSSTSGDADVFGREDIDQYLHQSENKDDSEDDHEDAGGDRDSNNGDNIFEEEVVDDHVTNADNDKDPYNFEGSK